MGKPLLDALSSRLLPTPPVWIMRQAGRYLPEYRKIRTQAGSFLNLCLTPELAKEVTLQPIRRFDLDAAIIFSDILIIPYALGRNLTFAEGEGPRLEPLTQNDLSSLLWEPEKARPVYQALQQIASELPPQTTLIGFAGGPLTVACYLIDGRGGAFPQAALWRNQHPKDFGRLIDILTETTIQHLRAQIEAGAEALQLFDSWAGLLEDETQFQQWIIDPTRRIISALQQTHPHVPVIGFPREATPSNLLAYAEKTGVRGLSLSHTMDLDWASQHLPAHITLQGNLAPQLLVEGGEKMKRAVAAILAHAHRRPWIFNLGHGIEKETPITHVEELLKQIRTPR